MWMNALKECVATRVTILLDLSAAHVPVEWSFYLLVVRVKASFASVETNYAAKYSGNIISQMFISQKPLKNNEYYRKCIKELG